MAKMVLNIDDYFLEVKRALREINLKFGYLLSKLKIIKFNLPKY